MTGFGMRAKPENSSTIRRMSPTCRTMVSVHWSNTFRSSSPDPLPEPPLQPLRRKLDRRQRILDLMRDAPRHVRPGGTALRRHQIGDVVERDDQALDLAAGALLRDLDVEGAQLAVARSAGSARAPARGSAAAPPSSTGASAGMASPSGRPTRSLSARPSAASADRLTSVTAPAAVEADHAGRNARQHRLREAAALVDLLIGREQLGRAASSAGSSWC